MGIPVYQKFPGEDISVGFDFTGKLPSGVTLADSGSTAMVVDKDGEDVSADVLYVDTVAVEGSTASARLKANAAQVAGQYLVRLELALSEGGPLQETAILLIKPDKFA